MIDSDYASPDGALRFLVRSPDGYLTMGFDGYPWHTHGELLAQPCETHENATKRFVADLISNNLIIAVVKVSGTVHDIRITYDPADDLRYLPPEKAIEFRLWDGTRIDPSLD
jgi:hypothetical protein